MYVLRVQTNFPRRIVNAWRGRGFRRSNEELSAAAGHRRRRRRVLSHSSETKTIARLAPYPRTSLEAARNWRRTSPPKPPSEGELSRECGGRRLQWGRALPAAQPPEHPWPSARLIGDLEFSVDLSLEGTLLNFLYLIIETTINNAKIRLLYVTITISLKKII